MSIGVPTPIQPHPKVQLDMQRCLERGRTYQFDSIDPDQNPGQCTDPFAGQETPEPVTIEYTPLPGTY